MKRPELAITISVSDFKNHYWLKSELLSFCRANGINTSGGKIELTTRIEQYLATGKCDLTLKKPASDSNFDWKNAELNLSTTLTDNYKNTENVRAFMTLHIGSHFKFNTEFMNWTKNNVGKTLSDAIQEWNRIYVLKKKKQQITTIAPQFEYNLFIRDYFANNPTMKLKDAIECWKAKRGE
jgi:hypothetical protein